MFINCNSTLFVQMLVQFLLIFEILDVPWTNDSDVDLFMEHTALIIFNASNILNKVYCFQFAILLKHTFILEIFSVPRKKQQ